MKRSGLNEQLLSSVCLSKAIAARLREMAAALNMSQRELAERLITSAYDKYIMREPEPGESKT